MGSGSCLPWTPAPLWSSAWSSSWTRRRRSLCCGRPQRPCCASRRLLMRARTRFPTAPSSSSSTGPAAAPPEPEPGPAAWPCAAAEPGPTPRTSARSRSPPRRSGPGSDCAAWASPRADPSPEGPETGQEALLPPLEAPVVSFCPGLGPRPGPLEPVHSLLDCLQTWPRSQSLWSGPQDLWLQVLCLSDRWTT